MGLTLMSELKTDEEKAEELKAWWKENGNSVLAGVAIAIAALFGWDYWKKDQLQTAEAASTLYTQSQQASEDATVADQLLQDLQTDYSSTPYAAMASLQLAKQQAEAGEYQKAADALQWVVDNSSVVEYQQVAKIRLARVLTAMAQYDKAQSIISESFSDAYESLVEEIRGDIFAAQNKSEEARKAYERAILTNQGGSSDFIQMKLDNLEKGA